MVTIGKGGLQSGSSLFNKKKKPTEQPIAQETPKKTSTVEFKDFSGRGDVKVDGQLLSRGKYNAYLDQIGGGSRSGTDPGLTPDVLAMAQAENAKSKEAFYNKEIEQQAQKELAVEQYKIENKTPAEQKLAADLGNIQASGAAGELTKPEQPDVVDVGKTALAGIGGGVATGALAGTLGAGPVGTIVGGIAGGLLSATASYFGSVGSERKQQVKVSNTNFKIADQNINRLFNDANSGSFNPAYLEQAYELEWARVYKARDELKLQQEALFGEKLSKSRDELAIILDYIARKPITDARYNFAISNPSGQIYEIKPYEDTESDKGFFEDLFG